jgi:hypothetical protein
LADRAYRVWLLAGLLWCAAPSPAAADWYFTPFLGWTLGGTTTLPDPDYRSDSRGGKITIGGSVAFIKGIVGLEADYALVPGFFRNPDREPPTIAGSRVQTVTGSLIVAAPLALTRESLRPYVLAGVGWIGASSEIFLPGGSNADLFVDEDMLGINVGGGAIGMFSNRTGVRFDLRRVWHLHGETAEGSGFGTELKFWRGTIGVTLRY